jgi:hypothetical protein
MAGHSDVTPLGDGYEITLKKLRVPVNKINYYLHWVKRFEGFLNGLALRKASSNMIEAFLEVLKIGPAQPRRQAPSP